MKLFGLLLFTSGIIAAIILGGSIYSFIDIISLLFILVTVLGVLITKFGFNFKEWASEEGLTVIGNTSLFSGCVGFVIGGIHLLQNASDVRSIGPAFAVALLCPLYSMFFFMICYMFRKSSSLSSRAVFVPFIFNVFTAGSLFTFAQLFSY